MLVWFYRVFIWWVPNLLWPVAGAVEPSSWEASNGIEGESWLSTAADILVPVNGSRKDLALLLGSMYLWSWFKNPNKSCFLLFFLHVFFFFSLLLLFLPSCFAAKRRSGQKKSCHQNQPKTSLQVSNQYNRSWWSWSWPSWSWSLSWSKEKLPPKPTQDQPASF